MFSVSEYKIVHNITFDYLLIKQAFVCVLCVFLLFPIFTFVNSDVSFFE